jgi:hypothetical protein
MSKLLQKLWNDDCGALIATEFLFVATILVLGIIVGLVSVRNAVNTELAELANAILALSQEYTISGQTGCCSSVAGSATFDTFTAVDEIICGPAIPQAIDQFPCQ